MIRLGFVLFFSIVIPFVVMAMLTPSLKENAPKSNNFRGVPVYNGLGIVWFVWLISSWLGAHILVALGLENPGWIVFFDVIFPLLVGTCALGLFDDWAGCNNTKGFKGHLRALRKGRLTTGGLKFIGIGFLCLFLAISVYYEDLQSIPRVILVTCTVALMANLLNLFDLRPGRAQKMYLVILLLTLPLIVIFGVHTLGANGYLQVAKLGVVDVIALVLSALGPIIATWRYDLAELGMLGDAGANTMGALLGFLIVLALPTWALALVTVALGCINLLSERYSFTKIIANNKVLSYLDALGRKNK